MLLMATKYFCEVKMGKRLVLGNPPKHMTAEYNRASWSVVAAIMQAYGGARLEDLAAAVSQHRHVDGGSGFVKYCVRQGWLNEVTVGDLIGYLLLDVAMPITDEALEMGAEPAYQGIDLTGADFFQDANDTALYVATAEVHGCGTVEIRASATNTGRVTIDVNRGFNICENTLRLP